MIMPDIKNKAGAMIYGDIKKHKMLDIPEVPTTNESGKVYHVLSVGVHRSGTALVTVKERGKAIAYQLPGGFLQDWAMTCISQAKMGLNHFPCDVEFGKLPSRYYAEML